MSGQQAQQLGAGEPGRPDDPGVEGHRMIIRATACPCNGRSLEHGVWAPDPTGRMEAMYGSTPTKGRILLATPPLEDPNFDRTVIYVLEHHDEGALGPGAEPPEPGGAGRRAAGVGRDAERPVARVRRRPGRARCADRHRPGARAAAAAGRGRRRERHPPRAAQRRSRLGRPRRRPDRRRRHDQRPARVPRLRRVGAGPARRRDRSRRLARARPRPHRPVHRHARRPVAHACCAASPAAWRGWPRHPTTSPPTDPRYRAARPAPA